ncbi:hypothetical protein CRE_22165 [Caenorhabditis remanei]|uniref:Uncharacterized protein n=1 Tax=Caenorhabditis remanei TaxID=31234 RepID=E3NKF8_CAERE|nr:hypothetical protein CRE_22165 [Caenorhabditis remanei]
MNSETEERETFQLYNAKDDLIYLKSQTICPEIALKYIRWLEHLDPDLKPVYGCMWHGCKFCYPTRDVKCPKRTDVTMGVLYDATMARKSLLEQEGFTVSSIWECEIKSELKKNRETPWIPI